MDKQIINLKCEMCNAISQPGICILNVNGIWLCGNCFMKWQEKMRKKTLIELREMKNE